MTTSATPELREIVLEELVPADDNPRRDVGDVTELAASIKTSGLIEPIVAMPDNGHYKIVAGARRFAGAKLAGLKVVPVIVRDFDERSRQETMLIENLQRTDLTAIEEGRAYKRLVELGLKQRELAKRIGRSQAHVSKRLALLDLPEKVQDAVDSGGITLEDAQLLAKLRDHPDALARVIKDGFHGLHWRVESALDQAKMDAQIEKAEDKLERGGETVARLVRRGAGGWHALPEGVSRVQKIGYSQPGYVDMDPKKHAKEPCHAIAVNPQRPDETIECCTEPKRHPQKKASSAASTKAQRDWEKQQQAREQDAKRRREFLTTHLAGRPPKASALGLLVDATLDLVAWQDVQPLETAYIALGLEPRICDDDGVLTEEANSVILEQRLREVAAESEAQLVRVATALALVLQEDTADGYGGDAAARYFGYLQHHGYELSDAERAKLPKEA